MILEGTPGKWDANGVHTLSIVEAGQDGWKYWGYYCGGERWYSFGAGLARSNDLVHWTKYSVDEPLVSTDPAGYGGRWPCVVKIGALFYMLVTKDYITDSHIVLYTSRDGIKFNFMKEIIQPETGLRNQNPNLLYDDIQNKWILYYYHGNDKNLFQIRARAGDEITDLDDAEDMPVLVNDRDEILASPSMFHWKGKYYLLTETTIKNRDDWRTRAWAGNQPFSGFVELRNSPLPPFIHACAFQHYLDDRLVITYSYQRQAQPEWEWDVRITQAAVED
jgi:hypothetical protein